MATTEPSPPRVSPPRSLKDLPIWGQRLYLTLLALSDAETGLCPTSTESGGQRGLAHVLSDVLGGGLIWYERQVSRLVDMGVILRKGPNRMYLSRMTVSLRYSRTCVACGLKSDSQREGVCVECHASGWTRSDRRWRVDAIEMAVAGKSPAVISARLGLPLWRIEDAEEAESMSLRRDEASGIVPHLYRHGLLSAEWKEAWEERDPAGYAKRNGTRRRKAKK